MKYFHVALAVNDLIESMSFYEKVFGYRFKKQGERSEIKVKFVMMENDEGNVIEFFEHKKPQPLTEDLMDFSKVGLKQLAFTVDNIEETIRTATKNGAKIIWPVKQGVTVKRIAFISDPDAIPIELVEL